MDAVEDIAHLVLRLAEEQREATPDEAARIRELFARRGLPEAVTGHVRQKYEDHVEDRQEWPSDTTPEEYLESLRATVSDARSSIYVTFEIELNE